MQFAPREPTPHAAQSVLVAGPNTSEVLRQLDAVTPDK
jgi:hypothetical protein